MPSRARAAARARRGCVHAQGVARHARSAAGATTRWAGAGTRQWWRGHVVAAAGVAAGDGDGDD